VTGSFDPYRKWLAIPPEEQPPNHYRLLGVPLFEDDAEAISHAADQRIAYVRTLALGDFADVSQRVLNELAAAKVCLLNREKKAAYDERLHVELAPPSIPQEAELATAKKHARPPTEPPPVPPPSATASIPPPPIVSVRIPTLRPPPSLHTPPPAAMIQPVDAIPALRAGAKYARRLRAKSTILRRGVAAVATGMTIGLVAWIAWRNSDTGATPGKTIANRQREKSSTSKAESKPAIAQAPFSADQARRHQKAWAKYLGRQVVETNSIGMKLVLIPPGEFEMGSPPSEEGHGEEELEHLVRITKPFYMGAYEVTQGEYEQVMGENPSMFSQSGGRAEAVTTLDTERLPVESVSWKDADAFCRKLSALAVEQSAGRVYRLPTEAEWEYACRAGTTTPFHFGGMLNGQAANVQGISPYETDVKGPSLGRTTVVGSYDANGFGLNDTHGNAREWCQDWYVNDYYSLSPRDDPPGPMVGTSRIVRDGSPFSDVQAARSAFRDSHDPMGRVWDFGFRVVADLKSPQSPPAPVAAPGEIPPLAISPFDTRQARAYQETWANYLGRQVVETNSFGMKLILIPPGEFPMGSPPTESRRQKDELQHLVRITKPYFIGVHEVTQKEHQAVLGTNPSNKSAGKIQEGRTASQHPVEGVNWFEAVDFCNKLSAKEHLSPYYLQQGETVSLLGGTGYRLPTEAEWEYACRAGTTTRWSFGDNERDLAHHAWFNSNAGGRTHRVAALSANPFGLYDLFGNVWEWCWDLHGEYASGEATDTTGSPTESERVLRGGAFYSYAANCRSAYRRALPPINHSSFYGIRVARTIATESPRSPPTAVGSSSTHPNDIGRTAGVNPPPLAVAPFSAEQARKHQEDWAKYLGRQVVETNSIGMKLVLIPPGEFIMGSSVSEAGRQANEIAHNVRITKPLYIGIHEVTKAQFARFVEANNYQTYAEKDGEGGWSWSETESKFLNKPEFTWRDLGFDQTDDHPVLNVSFHDATAFCQWLAEEEGKTYRLPTEAEWEYTCRAGTTTRFYSGDDPEELVKIGNLADGPNKAKDGYVFTAPVGQYQANAFGLNDMTGNAWEWCADWYDDDYYRWSPTDDPQGPTTTGLRLLRGGSWDFGADDNRSAYRGHCGPGGRYYNIGFRVVAEVGMLPRQRDK